MRQLYDRGRGLLDAGRERSLWNATTLDHGRDVAELAPRPG